MLPSTAIDETVREASFGGSAALSLRIVPNVLVGSEIWISATMTARRCRLSPTMP